jgi:hypothetical protein
MSEHPIMQPSRPTHLPDYAQVCLQALSAQGLGDRISLGGAFALLHYLDYRPTHDVDAWWVSSATAEEREKVLNAIGTALAPSGQVQRRAWGDVVSVELVSGGKTVFGFQIASRSAQLHASQPAVWTDVLLDSFPDIVASKMVALVERGAPRDFRDIYAVCQANLASPARCWQWWRTRQQLGGSDADASRARLAVQTHLARIAQHRPLAQIKDAGQRATAERVRTWYVAEFLDALLD